MDEHKPSPEAPAQTQPEVTLHAPSAPGFYPLRLVLQGGELAISLLRPDMVCGRHSETDVRLPLPDVSRRHCRFIFSDSRWKVFDLNSLNGIHVNGRRVEQATLADKDVLRIGSFHFEVELSDDPAEGRPPPAADKGLGYVQRISAALAAAPADAAPPHRQAS
jgi:predicted component of type VI protein secretion system